MGYCVSMSECDFIIKKENQELAFNELKNFSKNKELKWVNSEYIQECEDLAEAFNEIGWEFEFDEVGNIIGMDFCREKLGDENDIFNSIALYIEEGSYIEMYGEDGDKWRWIFKNGKCEEVYPKVIWE